MSATAHFISFQPLPLGSLGCRHFPTGTEARGAAPVQAQEFVAADASD
jgi:hypothetical protein